MGSSLSNFSSKLKCTVRDDGCGISWSWKGPPGEHSPYPVEKFVEKDHEVLYCFVDVLVAFKIMSKWFAFQREYICFPNVTVLLLEQICYCPARKPSLLYVHIIRTVIPEISGSR